jgi:hypothetical protein
MTLPAALVRELDAIGVRSPRPEPKPAPQPIRPWWKLGEECPH